MTSRPMGRLSQQPFFNQLFGTHAMDGYFFLGTHLMDHYFRKLLGTRGAGMGKVEILCRGMGLG
jgi:hypothetical protein